MNIKYILILFFFSDFLQCAEAGPALSEHNIKLLLACKTGNRVDFDAAIKAGADINAIDPKTKTAAWYSATEHKKIALLEALFKHGARFVALPEGESYYTRGLRSGGLGLLQLLKKYGAQPSKDPAIRKTDLQIIITSGSFQSLRFGFENRIFLTTDITEDIIFFTRQREDLFQPSAQQFRFKLEKIRTNTYDPHFKPQKRKRGPENPESPRNPTKTVVLTTKEEKPLS